MPKTHTQPRIRVPAWSAAKSELYFGIEVGVPSFSRSTMELSVSRLAGWSVVVCAFALAITVANMGAVVRRLGVPPDMGPEEKLAWVVVVQGDVGEFHQFHLLTDRARLVLRQVPTTQLPPLACNDFNDVFGYRTCRQLRSGQVITELDLIECDYLGAGVYQRWGYRYLTFNARLDRNTFNEPVSGDIVSVSTTHATILDGSRSFKSGGGHPVQFVAVRRSCEGARPDRVTLRLSLRDAKRVVDAFAAHPLIVRRAVDAPSRLCPWLPAEGEENNIPDNGNPICSYCPR